jgi:hypothetical protein
MRVTKLSRSWSVFVALSLTLLLLSGCQNSMHDSSDYNRHTYSRITNPLDGGAYLWFDVKITATMPGDDEQVNAQHMLWLEAWLSQRKLCPHGYEILEKRPFEFLEHNPARLDLRYKVSCLLVQSE